MEKLTLTALRKDLFRVVDRVLATGIPVAIERGGGTVLITSKTPRSKLSTLKRRNLIRGDPRALVDVKASRWREARKLK